MPVVPHDKQLEPSDDAELWRFLKLEHFKDLIANEELYFRRTDTYKADDPNEGLPTDRYLRNALGLQPYLLEDELQLNHHQASNRLHSECYYLSCWNLSNDDSRLRMWYRYAPSGVAIRTTYGRLRSVLDGFVDDVHLGQVRYGDRAMTGYNALQILFTKGENYHWENEVRAALCSYDPVGGQARNYRDTPFPHREPQEDLNPIHSWVHVDKRRRVKLAELLLGLAVAPWASKDTFEEVDLTWATLRGHRLPVVRDLHSPLTPPLGDLKLCGWGLDGDALAAAVRAPASTRG
jgi:hypothetical protein